VLFICHGNLCRSPFAELVFLREMRGTQPGLHDAVSAGFVGPNRRPPTDAVAAGQRLGIDLAGHRSQLVTAELVRASTLVVVMSAEQARAIRTYFAPTEPMVIVLGDLDPLPIAGRTIRDPWSASAEVFDTSYARIERCVRELALLISPSS
jgi:protein-tyrosine phosphatase